jgi:hypothetical protein
MSRFFKVLFSQIQLVPLRSGGGGGASGYYNGSDDPFGFNYKESASTGDHHRRINRNIRVLYVSLACLGGVVQLECS